MRHRLLAAVTALLLSAPLAAQTPAADSAGIDALRRELLQMGRLDQEVREGFSAERVQDTAYVGRMMRVDSAHTTRMREILRTHGWPGISLVGEDAAAAAFLLVQHTADNDLQRTALSLMEAAPRGEVSLPDLAMLSDRVRVRQGLPQRYGSQFSLVDGRWIADPIDDLARLDERRASMGLPPMADYVRMMQEAYGAPVEVPGWTPPQP
ncbi:MAG TPA: DUF6624 domain-containing protein [Longimicrobium sp.]|jgi:hypothetical protein|uniref:DUF6624 domain-containing protein n=1 Tax=Longimicrobium sp. TaxID=2029185 RepID=UPI002EDAA947